ncbi:MAG: succinylglutamate desuccinylase/aspartoacylase family protein [bacterium]
MTTRREDTPVPGVSRTAREIGHAGGHTTGPTVVIVAAIHGNEPAGIVALRRVFRKIEDSMISVRGEVVGLAGNLPAIAVGKRYISHDLNRRWTWERIATLDRGPHEGEDVEDHEQRELLRELRDRARPANAYLLDLHTASAPTVPFVILGDTLRNREFARRLPTPIVLGVEEQLEGTLMEYATSLGYVAVAFEGGQNDDPASVDLLEAAIWLLLIGAGAVAQDEVPEFDRCRAMLARARQGLPQVLEIFHRHAVDPDDGFVMRPGLRNFQEVTRGELLATDRSGEIRAPGNHRIFLPRYQGLGDDGFFLARQVDALWLAISSWLRRSGLPSLARRLPGVRPHPERRDQLVVDRRVARLFPRELFHLLGFKVTVVDRDRLVVTRRP